MSEGIDIVRLAGEKIDLCVRRTDEEALKLYLKWMNDETFNWYIGKHGKVTGITEEREWMNKKPEEGQYNFSIVEKATRKLIGNCGFTVHRDHFSGSLGICIGEHDMWNKGYGTEAIKMMIDYGFKELNLHRMCLTVCDDNERAQACYKKAGLTVCGTDHEIEFHQGEWRSLIRMEILNPDHKK